MDVAQDSVNLSENCNFKNKSVDENFVYNERHSVKAVEKCRTWLNSCSLSDEEDSDSDVAPSSVTDISEAEAGFNQSDEVVVINNNDSTLNDIIGKAPNNFQNINVYKSNQVHIGDVTQINGPVYINQFAPVLNQQLVIYNKQDRSKTHFSVVSRKTWLAQPPSCEDDIEYLSDPAKFVIISHSATEEAFTQAENNLTVRLIQQFHVESRKWNDIAYNFLIGAEGTVYQGRGWGIMGAHTFGYNRYSVGICFIGCYVNKLPTPIALKKARSLINYGIEIGKIDKDYRILGHCQCTSTESPGRKLFEEIKTWNRWDASVSVENPSPTAVTLLF